VSDEEGECAVDLNELVAIEGIRKTMADYVFFTDNGKIREFAALFGESGVFVLPDGSASTGAGAIRALLEGHAAYFAANPDQAPPGYLRHQITTVDITLTGDGSASAESYFMTLTKDRVDHWGKWSDQLARAADGRWLFVKRVVTTDGFDAQGWFAQSFSKM
jgi:hypothetical protein